MRVGYRRVSTDTQNMDRQELPDCERIFEETASGAKRDRPQLNELLLFIREGDEVVVHELSRLARSLSDLQEIVKAIVDKGCSITFLTENLKFSPDSDDPFATLQLQMMAAFAEFERKLIRKRQSEGIQKAKEAGRYQGRKQSINMKQLMSLHDANISPTEIAKLMNISRSSVYRLLDLGNQHKEVVAESKSPDVKIENWTAIQNREARILKEMDAEAGKALFQRDYTQAMDDFRKEVEEHGEPSKAEMLARAERGEPPYHVYSESHRASLIVQMKRDLQKKANQ